MKKRLIKKHLSLISALVITMTSSACTTTGPIVMPKTDLSEVVDLNTFNRISYDASKEYEEATDRFNKGCDPATIIHDDETVGDKKIALIIQGNGERELIEQALELLDQYKYQAAFTVTAMDAAEDDNTVKLIADKGHEIIDAGVYGNDSMELLSDEELIWELSSSRKVFSMIQDIPPSKLMLKGTYYTDSVCTAAAACGYDRIVMPSAGSYLNGKSFADKEKTQEYVEKLSSGKILVYKLTGYIDAVETDPKTESKKPAIDKQPTTDAKEGEEEEDNRSITTLSWLLEALSNADQKTVSLNRFKAMTDREYVNALLEKDEDLKADVFESIEIMTDCTALSFCGLPANPEVAEDLKTMLQSAGAGATFFVSGDELAAYKESAEILADGGFSFATTGNTKMDTYGQDIYDVYNELSLGKRKLQNELALRPRYYMPMGRIDDELLKAAKVAGLTVIKPRRPAKAVRGKISCFYLSDATNIDDIKKYLRNAQEAHLEVVDVTTIIGAIDVVPEIDPEILIKLREENKGKLAIQRNFVYTTEKALTILFYGVSNKVVLEDVLNILKKWGYKATFFVTTDELKDCSEQIEKIIEAGHEVGLAYIDRPDEEKTQFDKTATVILGAQEFARWKYDYELKVVFQPYGDILDETKEAVRACGCSLAGHEFSMVQSKYADAEDISFYSALSSKILVHRGSIAYFNINYFSADKDLLEDTESTLCGKLLSRFISNKIRSLTYTDIYGVAQPSTSYRVTTFSALSGSRYVYSPKKASNLVSLDKNVLGNMQDAASQNNYMISHYIGNPDTTYIPGFSDEDLRRIDTTGKINSGKVIFLTFDDWGDETDINQLLYVLDKYGVKANFFIRTNFVKDNPNLLRAIAVSGHMVGSHSDTHYVAWHSDVNDKGEYSFESLTEKEAAELRADVVKSYATLSRYCGDVVVDGKPALSTIYRPPTLGVSRIGMYQIFDVGFSHIVCGNFSSGDYAAESVDDLVNELRNGKKHWYGYEKIGGGTVAVMHMSPQARYTPGALDIMIPEWQAQGYTFGRLDDYLH